MRAPRKWSMQSVSDILSLKHESSIFRSFIQPWMWVQKCQASSPWAIMEKPHTGLDDYLNMLLSCFREKMSGPSPTTTTTNAISAPDSLPILVTLFIRGPPYMTSTQKGVGGRKLLQICGHTVQILQTEKGEGVKKSQNYVDILHGTRLTQEQGERNMPEGGILLICCTMQSRYRDGKQGLIRQMDCKLLIHIQQFPYTKQT